MRPNIRSQSKDELAARLRDWGEPAYRVVQVLEWLYARRVSEWDRMSNLSRGLRDKLSAEFTLHPLELVRQQGSNDSTRKFLWRLADHSLIESVLIPATPALYGEPSDRHTLCISTQVGCAYGCRFCASGLAGFKRNLLPDEIVGQVLDAETISSPSSSEPGIEGAKFDAGRTIDNLVVMGMGEPLANYDHLMKALRILNAPWGGGIGARKITISTSGLAPQIVRLADEPMQFRLAISLHGATDETRNRIMPVNRKYPLKELVQACDYYERKKGRRITLEYILIAGINDMPDQAMPLATLARRLHAKVNLIPYNHVEGLSWERPDQAAQEQFLDALQKLKVTVTLRREKGHDIDAACGQLRLKTERELEMRST